MIEHRVFEVGGHTFTIDFPTGILSEKELTPYAPFQTDSYNSVHSSPAFFEGERINDNEEDSLFHLTLICNKEELRQDTPATVQLEDDNGKMIIFPHEDDSLTFFMSSPSGKECSRLRISKGYHTARAWIDGTPAERRYALDTVLMLLYTFASASYGTLLLHASAVEYAGKGYLFLGKSGTGKSTHSRLWLEHVKDSDLLNDDNPIVRIIGEDVYVYGSPWSGKTPCYRNRKLPAGGIVRLHQAPFNRITPLSAIKAYAALLPSCSCLRWNHMMAESIHATISKVIEKVAVYSLECLPDREAAVICSNAVYKYDRYDDTHIPQ